MEGRVCVRTARMRGDARGPKKERTLMRVHQKPTRTSLPLSRQDNSHSKQVLLHW